MAERETGERERSTCIFMLHFATIYGCCVLFAPAPPPFFCVCGAPVAAACDLVAAVVGMVSWGRASEG